MDIRQLRFLTALAKERHFARAAEISGITQPTLSARIKQLEEELGVTIVERGQRFKGFTAEGEAILRWARQILADCDAMGQELSEMQGLLRGRLDIGVIPTALAASAELSKLLRSAHPSVRLHISSMSSRQIVQALENFELHLGVTYLDNEKLGPLRVKELYKEHYALVSRQEIGKGPISWAEAANLPLCLMTQDMQHRRIVDSAFAEAGTKPEPVVETNAVSALVAHVEHAGVSAILTDRQLTMIGLDRQINSRRLVQPTIEHKVGLVALERSPMTSIAKTLWDLC